MLRIRKAVILSGVASLIVALFGAVLMISQPAQSKNDRQNGADGVITQLGF